MPDGSLYETDIVAWVNQQVAELRRLAKTAPSNAIDWDNVIEEVESVGRSQVNGVKRKLVLILAHLLKVISAPDSPACRGWRAEIGSFQRVVNDQFSPSMRRVIDWQRVWNDARAEAAAALTVWGDELIRGLPSQNPFGLDDIVAQDFDTDEALRTMAAAVTKS